MVSVPEIKCPKCNTINKGPFLGEVYCKHCGFYFGHHDLTTIQPKSIILNSQELDSVSVIYKKKHGFISINKSLNRSHFLFLEMLVIVVGIIVIIFLINNDIFSVTHFIDSPPVISIQPNKHVIMTKPPNYPIIIDVTFSSGTAISTGKINTLQEARKTTIATITPHYLESINFNNSKSSLAIISSTAIKQDKLVFVSDRGEYDHWGLYEIEVNDTNNPDEWQGLPIPSGYSEALWPAYCGNQLVFDAVDQTGLLSQWTFIYDRDNNSSFPLRVRGSPYSIRMLRCSQSGRYWIYDVLDMGIWNRLIWDRQLDIISIIKQNIIEYPGTWAGETPVYVREFPNGSTHIFIGEQDIGEGINPVIAPDQDTLAYICNSEIYVMNISQWDKGANFRQKFQSTQQKNRMVWVSMAWSNDSRWLYYTSADNGNWDIFRICPVCGSPPENITSLSLANEWMPVIQPE